MTLIATAAEITKEWSKELEAEVEKSTKLHLLLGWLNLVLSLSWCAAERTKEWSKELEAEAEKSTNLHILLGHRTNISGKFLW